MKIFIVIASLIFALVAFISTYLFQATVGPVLFTFLYVLIFLNGIYLKSDKEKIDIFRPYFLVSILLYLYSLAGIFYVNITGTTLYGDFVSDRSLSVFIWASLLTQFGISLGFLLQTRYFPKTIQVKSYAKKINDSEERYLLFFGFTLAIAFSFFIYKNFLPSEAVSYAEWSLQSRLDRSQTNTSGISEIVLVTTPTILLICSLIHILFSYKFNIILRVFSFLIIFLYLYTQLLSGARANLMITIILLATYINYKVYKFKFFEILLGGSFVYISINLISLIRVTSDPAEMIFLLFDQFSLSGLSFLSLERSSELLTSLNALTIIQGIEIGEQDFFYGKLFVQQILGFIPGFIWPGRPDFASVLYVKSFYPGIYESGGGFGFSVVAEGFWELGLIGCILYGFLTGLIGEKVYQLFTPYKERPMFIFLYALIFTRIVLLVHRSGLISSLKAALILSIPILFVIIVYKIIKTLKNENEDSLDA